MRTFDKRNVEFGDKRVDIITVYFLQDHHDSGSNVMACMWALLRLVLCWNKVLTNRLNIIFHHCQANWKRGRAGSTVIMNRHRLWSQWSWTATGCDHEPPQAVITVTMNRHRQLWSQWSWTATGSDHSDHDHSHHKPWWPKSVSPNKSGYDFLSTVDRFQWNLLGAIRASKPVTE